MNKNYIEHKGKVIEKDKHFALVMAIALDPKLNYKKGVIRCIVSRVGNVQKSGYIDRSELHYISGNSLEHFAISERIKIIDEDKIVSKLSKNGKLDFIGLEDPDIFIDPKTNFTHLYFTMPFLQRSAKRKHALVYLGHAEGKDLYSLKITCPVLMIDKKTGGGAKEISIAPLNRKGFRYNLFESSIKEKDFTYSTVRVAIVKDMGKPWKFGETAFHPKEHNIKWIGGHASPGPLFPKSFVDIGEGKIVGIMNGRESNKMIGKDIKYGMFSVGLFIYDYEKGKIDWVSPKPLIIDSEAKTITFASQFVETEKGKGILYAHVDDSFVRAYTLEADKIKKLLPKI
jgi:hypothetical protein